MLGWRRLIVRQQCGPTAADKNRYEYRNDTNILTGGVGRRAIHQQLLLPSLRARDRWQTVAAVR